jgi:hypothetical protein
VAREKEPTIGLTAGRDDWQTHEVSASPEGLEEVVFVVVVALKED